MTRRQLGLHGLVLGVMGAAGLLAGRVIWPAQPAREPKINVENVEAITPAVRGKYIGLRVYAPGGHPVRDCIAITSRDLAQWATDGHQRWTRRYVLANITIVPMDPPVPEGMKALPQANYFDVYIPMPSYLPDWSDTSFQTAALPTPCPSPRDRNIENRITEFTTPVQILKQEDKP